MSSREWLFAYEHKDYYHLVRVFNVGKDATVAIIDDPWTLWKNGEIGMLIEI